MNELIVFITGIVLGALVKAAVKSLSGFLAAVLLLASVFGMLSGRTELAVAGTFSLFGLAMRRRKNAR